MEQARFVFKMRGSRSRYILEKLCVQLTLCADGNVSSDLATLQCSNISELLESKFKP